MSTQDNNVRCWNCDKLLADVLMRPWAVSCPRCKQSNASTTVKVAKLTDRDVKCWRCTRPLVSVAERPWRRNCRHCGATTKRDIRTPADDPVTPMRNDLLDSKSAFPDSGPQRGAGVSRMPLQGQ